VADSPRGVYAILPGDDPDLLVRGQLDKFSKIDLIGCDGECEQRVAEVVGFIEAPAIGLHRPQDVQHTAFQERLVPRTILPSPFPATLSSGSMVTLSAITGVWIADASGCVARPRNDGQSAHGLLFLTPMQTAVEHRKQQIHLRFLKNPTRH